ncbi:MAG: hypothetical protein CME63_15530 [Halobacteriovoraceae bacterium]|nr:hypothetical protein [Halobacteriovoraceae bacterium]|tara:strand:+ start:215136 stop:215798 length:663 start_codon:yes stop_codon:yes gene_type:complete
MKYLIFPLFILFTSCSFLAKNHHRNQLLKHYASLHEYDEPFEDIVKSVKSFCEKRRDEQNRKSEPRILLGVNGFVYQKKLHHSWREVKLEKFGIHIKTTLAPIVAFHVLEESKDSIVLAGVNHTYRVFKSTNDKVRIEVKRLYPSIINPSQLPLVENQIKMSSYHGERNKIVDLDISIEKATRDKSIEWDLLEIIDHEARNSYVKKAFEVVDKKWKEKES